MVFRAFCGVGVVLALAATVCGQPRPQPGMQPPMEPFQADGTIEAMAPGRIQIATNANQNWLIFLQPQTKVEFTATAGAEFLRPGICVRFTAEMDKHGTVKQKVGQLAVITPTKEQPLGIWSEGAGPGGGAPPERFGKAGGAGEGTATYTVAARITAAQHGRLTVSTGSAALKIELTDDAKIDVSLADCTFARKGDRIAVHGMMLAGKPGMGRANDVKITAAEPLGGGKSKPVKPLPKTEPRPKKGPAAKEPPKIPDDPFGAK